METEQSELFYGDADSIAALAAAGEAVYPIQLGELLAEWITQGRASPDLALMAPDRMATGIAEDELRELCRLQYAHHYWSPETMPSGVTS